MGIPTVGFGHVVLPGERFTEPLTRAQGLALLRADVERVALPGLGRVNAALSQNQVDALTSFIFNIGPTAFGNSTALSLVNSGRFSEVPAAMGLFNQGRVQGQLQVLPGLVHRRAAEGALFAE